MLSLQKSNSFLSFHYFIFHSKIHKHPRTFLRGGGSKFKVNLCWGSGGRGQGVHVKYKEMNKG